MKPLRDLIRRVFPVYARRPLLAVLLFNFICYYIPKALESHRTLHVLSTALDNALPRVPAFIFIYVLAYVQWAVAYTVIARDSRPLCYRFVTGELLAKTVAMMILLIYPTTAPAWRSATLPPGSWLRSTVPTRQRTFSPRCTVWQAGSASDGPSDCSGCPAGTGGRRASFRCWSLPPCCW